MAKKAKKAAKASRAKTNRTTPARAGAGRRTIAKKAAKKGPAGSAYVDFGLYGMKEILGRIKEAGLEDDLNAKMGDKGLFVKVKGKSLTDLKEFIDSNEKLKSLSIDTTTCTCPDWDHYCIYLGQRM
jgi:hypothetical protein